jgi:AMP-binding enzyme
MILGQSSPQHMAMVAKAGRSTLDDVFRRAAARRPDALALADPPNRAAVTDGEPRRLTYAQVDRMISAVAVRLRRLGLGVDQIVGIQMANTVDAVVTLLGALRAGLIATPLPLLWRQADCVAALERVDARALIVSGRIGTVDHCALAMNVAAEVFQIRQVGGFGPALPDGVIGFDDLYAAEAPEPPPAIERPINPGAHMAVITWDVAPDGLVPVARSHFELLAAGAAVALESRVEHNAVLLSSLTLPSLAGLALAVVPWLLVGGTLALHHPFDDEVFLQQARDEHSNIVLVPAALALRLGESGALARRSGIKSVVAAWRAPEHMAASAIWVDPVIGLVDVPVFGETGVFAMRRGGNGRPAPLALGPVTAPRGAPGALHIAEMSRTAAGTIALRGPLVPKFPLPSDMDGAGAPLFTVGADGYADTGFPCTLDPATRTLAISGPPAGIVGVGGYRFAARALADLAAETEPGSRISASPDDLAGQRLAGTAREAERVRDELTQRGVNPLIAAAFEGNRAA